MVNLEYCSAELKSLFCMLDLVSVIPILVISDVAPINDVSSDCALEYGMVENITDATSAKIRNCFNILIGTPNFI